MRPESSEALEKLLAAAERRVDRGNLPEGASLPFTQERLPSYYGCTALELGEVHAELSVAERAGAICIDWDQDLGERGRVVRIRCTDATKVASLLSRVPRWKTFEIAREGLSPWSSHPRVERLFAGWREGKTMRSRGPESWAEWRDALRVLDSIPSASSSEIPLRRLSNALFKDSKRIEKLASCLDYLTSATLEDLPRDANDLFSELGLPRFPQVMLIASFQAAIVMRDGTVLAPAQPYIGLPPDQIQGFDRRVEYVMTIENLTSFNEAARQARPDTGAALIYTAGMPGPRFLAAYKRLLMSSGPKTTVLHWGDVDLGGLRIAAKLASSARDEGYDLALHDFIRTSENDRGRKEISPRERTAMSALCAKFGWSVEGAYVETAKWAREQEEDIPRMPWASPPSKVPNSVTQAAMLEARMLGIADSSEP